MHQASCVVRVVDIASRPEGTLNIQLPIGSEYLVTELDDQTYLLTESKTGSSFQIPLRRIHEYVAGKAMKVVKGELP
jgi:hypothetical protein